MQGRCVADSKCAVGAVEVDALSHRYAANRAGKVAQAADRHLHAPVADGGAGGEDEWVASGLERAFPHREPSELARDEAEPRMTLRLHHQRMGIASFLAHLCHAVRAA